MIVTKFCRGDPIPSKLIEKIDEYIPHDFAKLLNISKVYSKLKITFWHHFSYGYARVDVFF